MAGGQIDGFFRKAKAGQPLRALANVDNLNRVANVLNDITGEGCTIEKPKDGTPWVIHVSDTVSDNEPFIQKKLMQLQVTAPNQAYYDPSHDYIGLRNPQLYVNNLSVDPAIELERFWPATAGVKYIYIWQHFGPYLLDEDGQYTHLYLWWSTSTVGAGDGPTGNDALLAKIPCCRVDIPEVGQPPKIKNLIEGPVKIYCYRGDSNTRAFAESPANVNRQKPKSKTVDNASGGALPLKVRNIDGGTDGYYDAYPNGRYHIENSSGSDEVVWNSASQPEADKNEAKLLLLRYIHKATGIAHGQPYWRTIDQFAHNAETWIEAYAAEEIDDGAPWFVSVISPWCWEIWQEEPGPYQPKLMDDSSSQAQILAAVADADGNIHSVADIVVMQEDLDVALEDWEELSSNAEEVVSQIENLDAEASSASAMADECESSASSFVDFTPNVTLVEGEANNLSADVGLYGLDFADLDARITALERAVQ